LGFVSTHYGATGIFIVEAILCFAAVAVLALMKIDVKKEKSQHWRSSPSSSISVATPFGASFSRLWRASVTHQGTK
ncbi:hypothetical protein MJN07_17070, partial [Salmonella enterica subsp. enterica serovar Anatum]|nr:hypothetical protein [Salmonella enterica subsp. enterica serovar Anatum]